MSHFIRDGSKYFVQSDRAVDIKDRLPVGTYVVKESMTQGIFLEEIDSFQLPEKLYGNTSKYAKRILNTYQDRDHSTGCLFVGEKGSGKTLLSKVLADEGAKLGYPTIIVNAPFKGDGFNQLIQNIDQHCIVLFDEFEKVYEEDEDQIHILTLLDGLYSSKKLFLFTCNNKYQINSYMLNRPGRIYYMLEFEGLEEEFIREYCQDNLNDKEQIQSIINITALFHHFNFDILQNLIEEMNRYDEPASESIKLLNIKPEANDEEYKVDSLTISDKNVKSYSNTVYGDPFTTSYSINYHFDENAIDSIDFGPNDIVSMDMKKGEYCYEISQDETTYKMRLIGTRNKRSFDMSKFF